MADTTQATVPTGGTGGTGPTMPIKPLPTPAARPGFQDTPNPDLSDSDVKVSPFPKESRTFGLGQPSFAANAPKAKLPWAVIVAAALVFTAAAVLTYFLTK
jgi:hypothetical protein